MIFALLKVISQYKDIQVKLQEYRQRLKNTPPPQAPPPPTKQTKTTTESGEPILLIAVLKTSTIIQFDGNRFKANASKGGAWSLHTPCGHCFKKCLRYFVKCFNVSAKYAHTILLCVHYCLPI